MSFMSNWKRSVAVAANIRYTQVRKAKDNIRKGGTNNPKMRAKYGAANQDQNDWCDLS